MQHSLRSVLLALVVAVLAAPLALAQGQPEKRLGLVIGNSEYQAGALPTAANDAGLIAQTLQAAGFDVMGARDLDGDALRQTFRDFVEKVGASGPETVAFVYLGGHGLQFEGENFFVPVDARIDRDVDVPLQALRVSDYIRPLSALGLKAVVVVQDTAHNSPFVQIGQPLAGGLALTDPYQGMLYGFNAAPGTVAPPGEPPYGHYAQALAEMIREGGVPLDSVFERVRMRVHEATSGASVPWHSSQVKTPFVFFERAPDAPQEASLVTSSTRRARPIRDFDGPDAYHAALERDTLDGYLDFLRAHPNHPQADRVRAIVAARREAITWRRARNADSPEAYWTYLDRYPRGPHAWDARRRLTYLTAPPEPPPRYRAYDYDLPPPPPEEIVIIERRPVIYFADPYWRFAPLLVVPIYFLPPPPPPRFFRPPPPPVGVFLLPVPVFVPMARHVRPPVYVAPPPNNPIFLQVRAQNAAPGQQPAPPPGGTPPGKATTDRPTGPGVSPAVIGAGAALAVGAAAAIALPPSVAKRAGDPPRPGAPALPGTPGTTGGPKPGAIPTGLTPPGAAAPGATGPGVGMPNRALPGAPTGAPLPPPGAIPPSKTGTPQPPGIGKGPPPAPVIQKAQPPAPGQVPPPPKTATGTPPGPATGQPAPIIQKGPPSPPPAATPPPKTVSVPPPKAAPETSKPPLPPRLQKQEQAKQDRAGVEQKLLGDRQRDMDRRRQEEAAGQKGREQQQQMQRQQQEQQRRAMDQQRQQQQAAQAAAQARSQQAAQAAAQARAQAAAQAAAQAKAQSQPKKCGVPGAPPCPQ